MILLAEKEPSEEKQGGASKPAIAKRGEDRCAFLKHRTGTRDLPDSGKQVPETEQRQCYAPAVSRLPVIGDVRLAHGPETGNSARRRSVSVDAPGVYGEK